MFPTTNGVSRQKKEISNYKRGPKVLGVYLKKEEGLRNIIRKDSLPRSVKIFSKSSCSKSREELKGEK